MTLVTGGAGYVGAAVVEDLLDSGRNVRVIDLLLHGQYRVADDLRARGAAVVRGDILDGRARREALEGVSALVHLAAIVGDPACARDPERSQAVNVDATRVLMGEARDAGVRHVVFASTCSNYGRMADPKVPIDEDAELAPVSLYAEQKVAVERMLLSGDAAPMASTCLRFATV